MELMTNTRLSALMTLPSWGAGNSGSRPELAHPTNKNLETVMIDEGRLNQLIGQMVSDLGGASSVAMVRIGDALGLYKALHTIRCDDGGGTRFLGGCTRTLCA